MTKPQPTNCSCATPGHCPRHGCTKTAHWHHLCRTRPDYFELWEQSRGPGQRPTPNNGIRGLGDLLELLFRRTGIHSLVRRMQRLFGLRNCGCKRRQEKLNRLFPSLRRKN